MQGNTLILQSMRIATVSCLGQAEYQPGSGHDFEKTARMILNGTPVYKNTQSCVEAWWRTCITDMTMDGYPAPVGLECSFAA